MYRSMGALLLVFSQTVFAADGEFAPIKASAEAIEGLGGFLDKYVGDCGTDADCKRNVETFRNSSNRKKFYFMVSEDQVNSLQMGSSSGSGFTLNLTPIFPASNSAVTAGAPSKTDSAGNPVLPFMVLKGTPSDQSTPDDVARMVKMKTLRVNVVFTPMGLWTLPKKGGGKTVGVKARIEGIEVISGRTGEVVATYVAR